MKLERFLDISEWQNWGEEKWAFLSRSASFFDAFYQSRPQPRRRAYERAPLHAEGCGFSLFHRCPSLMYFLKSGTDVSPSYLYLDEGTGFLTTGEDAFREDSRAACNLEERYDCAESVTSVQEERHEAAEMFSHRFPPSFHPVDECHIDFSDSELWKVIVRGDQMRGLETLAERPNLLRRRLLSRSMLRQLIPSCLHYPLYGYFVHPLIFLFLCQDTALYREFSNDITVLEEGEDGMPTELSLFRYKQKLFMQTVDPENPLLTNHDWVRSLLAHLVDSPYPKAWADDFFARVRTCLSEARRFAEWEAQALIKKYPECFAEREAPSALVLREAAEAEAERETGGESPLPMEDSVPGDAAASSLSVGRDSDEDEALTARLADPSFFFVLLDCLDSAEDDARFLESAVSCFRFEELCELLGEGFTFYALCYGPPSPRESFFMYLKKALHEEKRRRELHGSRSQNRLCIDELAARPAESLASEVPFPVSCVLPAEPPQRSWVPAARLRVRPTRQKRFYYYLDRARESLPDLRRLLWQEAGKQSRWSKDLSARIFALRADFLAEGDCLFWFAACSEAEEAVAFGLLPKRDGHPMPRLSVLGKWEALARLFDPDGREMLYLPEYVSRLESLFEDGRPHFSHRTQATRRLEAYRRFLISEVWSGKAGRSPETLRRWQDLHFCRFLFRMLRLLGEKLFLETSEEGLKSLFLYMNGLYSLADADRRQERNLPIYDLPYRRAADIFMSISEASGLPPGAFEIHSDGVRELERALDELLRLDLALEAEREEYLLLRRSKKRLDELRELYRPEGWRRLFEMTEELRASREQALRRGVLPPKPSPELRERFRAYRRKIAAFEYTGDEEIKRLLEEQRARIDGTLPGKLCGREGASRFLSGMDSKEERIRFMRSVQWYAWRCIQDTEEKEERILPFVVPWIKRSFLHRMTEEDLWEFPPAEENRKRCLKTGDDETSSLSVVEELPEAGAEDEICRTDWLHTLAFLYEPQQKSFPEHQIRNTGCYSFAEFRRLLRRSALEFGELPPS